MHQGLYAQGAGTCVECGGGMPAAKLRYETAKYCGVRCSRRAHKRRYWAKRPGGKSAKKRRLEARTPERVRRYNRNRDLKLNYGITLEQYEALWASQGGRCAICGEEPPEGVPGRLRALAVDHCHTTGRNRGLLCFRCNAGIGQFRDSAEYLASAIAYLHRHA